MNENKCPACGAANAINSTQCKYCGEAIVVQASAQAAAAQAQQPGYQQPGYQQPGYQPPPPPYQQPIIQNIYQQSPPPQPQGQTLIVSTKSKVVAGLLGIFLGGIGVHKFYLGKIFQGIVYLLFCWTYIPSIIGFIEGIIYLCSSDENFARKYGKRAYQQY